MSNFANEFRLVFSYLMKKNLFAYALALTLGCSCVSCTQIKTKVAGLFGSATTESESSADGADKAFATKKLSIVKKCADSKGYKAGIIVDADYPIGNSAVAQSVAKWIAGYSVGSSYTGDVMDGDALFEKYAADFTKENSDEDIKKFIQGTDGYDNAPSEENEFEWYDNIKIVKEYDSKYFVSYTYQWTGFHVGNATSNATIKDCTFSKIDGSALGWEMFTSKNAVKELIDKALIAKYGAEGADLYGNGIPMPKAPLFMQDSVRFDYSDYTIVEPHYYEENGSFPYCTIAYKDMLNLLTDEAKQYLGLGGGKPKARKQEGVVAGKMQDFLSELDNKMNKEDFENLDIFYSDQVKIFGSPMSKEKALKSIGDTRKKFADYEQLSIYPKVTKLDDKSIRCDYLKRVTIDGRQTDYEAYLVLEKSDFGSYTIKEESDKTTDSNLRKKG